MIMIILGLMTVIVLMSKDQYNAYMLLIKKLFSNSGAFFLDECRLTIIFFDKSYLHLFHPILWMMCFIETCKLLPDKMFD